jgi:hypothetical protein
VKAQFVKMSMVGFSLIALGALSACQPTIVVTAPHCNMVPVQVCHNVRDYHGGWHQECGTEYQRRCYNVAATLGAPVGPVGVGMDFGMSFDAADRVIDAAVAANQGNLNDARNLGLSDEDFAQLANKQMPTDKGIDAVAQTLDQSVDSIRNFFGKIISETTAGDPNSVYSHH